MSPTHTFTRNIRNAFLPNSFVAPCNDVVFDVDDRPKLCPDNNSCLPTAKDGPPISET